MDINKLGDSEIEFFKLGNSVIKFFADCMKLKDGSLIVEDLKDKYCTGLTFIIKDEISASMFYEFFTGDIPTRGYFHYPELNKKMSDFNLGSGYITVLPGRYFSTKKNTQCFEVDKDGPELLLRDEWGGSYNNYKGHTLEKILLCDDNRDLWNLRTESKNGGEGIDYIIIPKDMKYEISIDDL